MKLLNLFLKRVFDLFSSLVGILVISPLLIVVSVLIKLDSEGPILFKQERLGKNGRVFKILKFRTMIVNAEKIGDGLTVGSELDDRITSIGRFLRKSSLDELPQLFNVLGGSMSLVGPRPPVTYYPYDGYDNYPSWTKKRFTMKPGVTGLTQVTVRNSVSWDERIKIDIEYIDSFNILYDILLILKTFVRLFKSDNVYMKIDSESQIKEDKK